jgi:NAD(P)H-hydrate epimerase
MIPLYTTDQIRKIDELAINNLGIPGIVLMENASREIFKFIKERTENLSIKSIGFICGKGNNGGDGFAAARHFANDGYNVVVIYLGSDSELSPDSKFNFSVLKRLSKLNKKIRLQKYKSNASLKLLSKCDIICDALLGSGTKGNLREPYLSIINYLNVLKKIKVAVDIPTGLNADTGYATVSFEADFTITLGELKRGLFIAGGYVNSGEIEKGGIGIPNDLYKNYIPKDYLIEPEDAWLGLPAKPKNIHKYSAGKVLTIAGSGVLPGAAVLTATSALKIGAGASILAFPKSIRSFVHKKLGEVVVNSYEDEKSEILREKNLKELDKKIHWADVIAIGPGLGREINTQKAILALFRNYKFKNAVIDADGIYALSRGKYKKLHLNDYVLTPHHAEFANLIGTSIEKLKTDLLKYGRNFVKETGAYLILKGAPTIIFAPTGESFINTTGNPSLAKFGTGDVLTGFLAGLLSQQKDIELAIVSAVYLHSLSADLLVRERSKYDILASDILNYLPKTIKFLENSLV